MTDKIRVRCIDKMVFEVDSTTLEPLHCSRYDAWAFSDPEPVPTMEHSEWTARRMSVTADEEQS